MITMDACSTSMFVLFILLKKYWHTNETHCSQSCRPHDPVGWWVGRWTCSCIIIVRVTGKLQDCVNKPISAIGWKSNEPWSIHFIFGSYVYISLIYHYIYPFTLSLVCFILILNTFELFLSTLGNHVYISTYVHVHHINHQLTCISTCYWKPHSHVVSINAQRTAQEVLIQVNN